MGKHFGDFAHAIEFAENSLRLHGNEINTGHWQGVPTDGKPDMETLELLNLEFEIPMMRAGWVESHTDWLEEIATEIKPNLPWADEHFAERVGREPTNPGEAYKNWPWWREQDAAFQEMDTRHGVNETLEPKFSHTYQERFWPKRANGGDYREHLDLGEENDGYIDRQGIRYDYGDLDDVLNLLERHPHTRQATLPIFFPEDTGAVHGGRVPCTLHYHFLLRNKKLHLWYPIRSCDAVRHFRDDLYLATRLCGWVIDSLVDRELRNTEPQVWVDVHPGTLYFTAYSFHVHAGDLHLL